MATKIITKNSSTATSIPTAGDLVQGELAVNVTDKRLFTEDSGGAIVELGTNPSTLTSGAATFSGGITATTGTFSSTVSADAITINGTTGTAETLLTFNVGFDNPSGEKSIIWKDATSPMGRISVEYDAGAGSTMSFGSLYNGGYQTSDVLTLASTGAATFSGEITTTSGPINVIPATTTTYAHTLYQNASGLMYVGRDSSAGSSLLAGSSAYAGIINVTGAYPIEFGTNNVKRMTLDASGNLLVGKTAANFTVAGHELKPASFAGFTRNGGSPVIVNRLTNDGDLIEFYRGATTVGSIGTEGGDLTIGNGDAGIQFVNGTEHFRPQNMTTNSATDGLMNIGSAAYRFKDLYLSGNANVASVVASSSVISPFFTTGSFSYTSGTTEIITIPQDSIYLFMSRPNNYGGSDNRHGAVYIIRRWSSSVGSTELAASAAGRGVFTIATGGTVTYGSTGAGVPSTAIYWMRIA